MKVLIAYATTEGQTRKIAEKIAIQVRELGNAAELVDVDRERHGVNVDDFNAVIVAASVHQHDHRTTGLRAGLEVGDGVAVHDQLGADDVRHGPTVLPTY